MTRNYVILAAYAVYTAFWVRLLLHGIVWWRAVRRLTPEPRQQPAWDPRACGLAALDVLFLGRLFAINPMLWLGEYVFHTSFLLVLLRHLRYFLNPVPAWVWWMQTPGIIAGYILPLSLAYILVIRLMTTREKYASPANMVLLGLMLVISCTGLFMNLFFKPDLVGVKLFILGLMNLSPVPPPKSIPFTVHFKLFLVLVVLLPTHIFTAPLVMYEARKRAGDLKRIMH